MHIAFFDLDGTITEKDTFGDFIKYVVGWRKYYLNLFKLIGVIISYKTKFISNDIAKEFIFQFFFRGWDLKLFSCYADAYSDTELKKIIRPEAIEKIEWHKEKGDQVVIVSASLENYLKKWCEKNGVDLIATRLEVKEWKLTGKFLSKNCYGEEKVNRIKEKYDLNQFDYIYAYGNSRGDKEMLSISDKFRIIHTGRKEEWQ